MSNVHARARIGLAALTLSVGVSVDARGAGAGADVEELRSQLEEVLRQNTELRRDLRELREEVRSVREEALAVRDLVGREGAPPARAASSDDGEAVGSRSPGAGLQLLDVSLDVLAAGGFSSATDDELLLLQGGDHDPRQRGFTLQQAELSFLGAVDPFLTGEAHLIYFLDTEGESRFELEEAFVTTTALPFGLEERGLQVEAGHFFTEFGRANPRHPHAWTWQDQPVVLSRFFGEDGMRAPGVRVGWLTPLPWYSELHAGVQTAKGETMASFLANDELFEARAVGGRPFGAERTGSANDLVKLLRWVNGFDLGETWSSQIGLSFLHGPNATGPDGRTLVAGADLVAKWRPLRTDRGWPFLVLESEILRRSYRADDFTNVDEAGDPLFLAGDTLRDWGGYAQLVWGFRRGWAVGLRYEYATGDGASVESFDSRDEDPFRADRHRVSPLLVWHPSEYSRLRLQYNYDRADHLESRDAHSLWTGIEFLFGSHPTHGY